VSAEVSGLDINAVGVILMIVGALGLVVSLVFWSSWGGFGGREAAGAVAARRRTSSRTTSAWGSSAG
jgi:hypothetical protein